MRKSGHISLYRLVKQKWADSPFDGEGAKLFGGRWNNKGHACVYLAENPSLAILEVLVHLSEAQLMDAYVLYQMDVPLNLVMKTPLDALPAQWNATASSPETAAFGDVWLDSKVSLALAVPSVLSPDWNYLLNVGHPAFEGVVDKAVQIDFEFDVRFRASIN